MKKIMLISLLISCVTGETEGSSGNTRKVSDIPKNLYEAAIQGDVKKIEEFLNGKDINDIIDVNGSTALILASQSYDNNKAVEYLLEKGANVNLVNKYERTALYYAITNLNYENFSSILNKSDKEIINKKDIFGLFPLFLASQNSNKAFLKHLLEKDGIDVNMQNEKGMTALMFVIKKSKEEYVELFLKKDGINLEIEDNSKKTVFGYAEGKEDILQMLREYKNK